VRVSAFRRPFPLRAWETVVTDTPASRATSRMLTRPVIAVGAYRGGLLGHHPHRPWVRDRGSLRRRLDPEQGLGAAHRLGRVRREAIGPDLGGPLLRHRRAAHHHLDRVEQTLL